ncbi:proline-rich receptor-like protein kinase PERK4 isoform X1 [Prosopis cineraria]|uniref:proline-rich receptor-like protein kinase PERK4 isoform X1 n=1 Tax=Prosopis cineraria TaxID=364024 RepID=UPI00240FD7CB|nr:proline-rich receptor-like protein kinase PERK4 isoform X1 [Prosopis cineraria]
MSKAVGPVLGIAAIVIIAIAFRVICTSKKRKKAQNYEDPHLAAAQGGENDNNAQPSERQKGSEQGCDELKVVKEVSEGTFTYEELALATKGFAKGNLIGEGGLGYVHKGVLPNGKTIAVKTLKEGGSHGLEPFQSESEAIARVHHRHLVLLLGFCISREKRMLVYEFVPCYNLEHHLHGKGVPLVSWPRRMQIAVGIARGLTYLHEDCDPRIVHRNIKAANVLIDESFEAKVADFGLSKVISDNNTHVSTRVMGGLGYLAPEYASTGKLTEKSDVFSFGVLLLEILTGKRPMDLSHALDDTLVDLARPLLNRGLEDGNLGELVDAFLEGNYDHQQVARVAACAAASIRHSPKKRPNMRQILLALEGNASSEDLIDAGIPPHDFH